MARDKHLSLDEARRLELLDQFAEETDYQEANRWWFDRGLKAMATGRPQKASGKRPAKGRTTKKA